MRCELTAIHSRHLVVGNDGVDDVPINSIQGLLGVIGRDDPIPMSRQQLSAYQER
jgi:hypothetical protein